MMAPTTIQLPIRGLIAGFKRFTVKEYHTLINHGYLTEDDDIELIEGYLVNKMARNPRHDNVLDYVEDALRNAIDKSLWYLRAQKAITLAESEPEPDVVLIRGTKADYLNRHPGPKDIGLVVEVSNTTLESDRIDKQRIYARASLPIYWIVNVEDNQIEVYSQPSGPIAQPAYQQQQIYHLTDSIPLILDGQLITTLLVKDLIP